LVNFGPFYYFSNELDATNFKYNRQIIMASISYAQLVCCWNLSNSHTAGNRPIIAQLTAICLRMN